MSICGERGKALMKNMEFSSLTVSGDWLFSQTILIGWLKDAGTKPQFGTILTGIGEEVNTKYAIAASLHGFEI